MKQHIRITLLCTLLFLGVFENVGAQTFLFDGKTTRENWEKNWTKDEKTLWYLHIFLQVADAGTTVHILERDEDAYEFNSFVYGKRPSLERLVATKAAVLWGMFSLLNDYTPKGNKKTGLIFLNIFYSVVVASNISLAYQISF